MRLYYPTLASPPNSLFRPRYFIAPDYCHGMVHFLLDIPKRAWWVRLLVWTACVVTYCTSFLTDTIPASLDAPLSCVDNHDGDDDGDDKNEKHKKHEKNKKNQTKLPVVVFSHGLAGNRNMYAGLLSSLASQGYLVAAIEHRDGSASCAAMVKQQPAAGGAKGEGEVTYQQYIHTDGNYAWRRKQVTKRVEELSAAIEALSAASDGRGAPRNVFPTSRFDASVLDGAVDISRLVAVGHSFGGATVMTACGKNAAIKRAVLMDPWTDPLGDTVAVRAASVPTLVMNSHKWGQDLSSLYRDSSAAWLEAEVAGTTHQDCCDKQFRMPLMLTYVFKGMKGCVNHYSLFDFKLALLHLFFDLTEGEESGGGGDKLAAALHEGGVDLVKRYRGKMEILMRSSASSSS